MHLSMWKNLTERHTQMKGIVYVYCAWITTSGPELRRIFNHFNRKFHEKDHASKSETTKRYTYNICSVCLLIFLFYSDKKGHKYVSCILLTIQRLLFQICRCNRIVGRSFHSRTRISTNSKTVLVCTALHFIQCCCVCIFHECHVFFRLRRRNWSERYGEKTNEQPRIKKSWKTSDKYMKPAA